MRAAGIAIALTLLWAGVLVFVADAAGLVACLLEVPIPLSARMALVACHPVAAVIGAGVGSAIVVTIYRKLESVRRADALALYVGAISALAAVAVLVLALVPQSLSCGG